jgi:hypothetical protein
MSVINWPVFCENDTRLDALPAHLSHGESPKLSEYYRITRSFAREMLNRFIH